MYVYCLNNPVSLVDTSGNNAEALPWWTGTMWWICYADLTLPLGDAIFIAGVIVISSIDCSSRRRTVQSCVESAAQSAARSLSPEFDDDYYDDDSNFGGRKKIGKGKGKMPGNNKDQNQQFRDATNKILSKDQQSVLHKEISGQGYGFHEIVEAANDLLLILIGLLFSEDS